MDLDDEPVPVRTSPRNKRAAAKKPVAQYIDLCVPSYSMLLPPSQLTRRCTSACRSDDEDDD